MPVSITPVSEPLESYAARINPARFNFSPKLTAIVGAIIHHDYGIRDRKNGKLSHLSITSDGFVLADSSAHESGAFISDYDTLRLVIQQWLTELSDADAARFWELWRANVRDWRGGGEHGREI